MHEIRKLESFEASASVLPQPPLEFLSFEKEAKLNSLCNTHPKFKQGTYYSCKLSNPKCKKKELLNTENQIQQVHKQFRDKKTLDIDVRMDM